MLVDMFMGQGSVGAMPLVLALYFFRTETQARQDRIKLTDELQNLVRESLDKTDIIEVKTDIAAINSKMTNLERERNHEGFCNFRENREVAVAETIEKITRTDPEPKNGKS